MSDATEADCQQTVSKITFSERAGGRLTFHLPDGSVYTASNEIFREAIAHATRQIISAAPGTYELHDWIEDGEVRVSKIAIIGWVVDQAGFVAPLTAASCGIPEDYAPTVLHPDGSVDHVLSHHGTYDEWVEYVRQMRSADPPAMTTDVIEKTLASLESDGEVVGIEEIDPKTGQLRTRYYAAEHAPKPS